MVTFTEYKEARQDDRFSPGPVPAHLAYRFAQWSPSDDGPWESRPYIGDSVQWERDGFHLTATLEWDAHATADGPTWIMESIHEREVDVPWRDRDRAHKVGSRWIVLHRDHTYEYYRESLARTHGRAEADRLARLYVEQDIERVRTWLADRWRFALVVVRAYRAGVELGMACLGGVESDAEVEYFNELAHELADEAVAEAQKTIEELCPGGPGGDRGER